jgi:hypothetical protein
LDPYQNLEFVLDRRILLVNLFGLIYQIGRWLLGYFYLFMSSSLAYSSVVLFIGGGSGHEPAHAGFVWPGMLSC